MMLRERSRDILAVVTALASIFGAGCIQTKSTRSVTLRPEQFADPDAPPPREDAPAPAPPPANPVASSAAPEVSDGVLSVTAIPGEPAINPDDHARPVGQSVLVDGTAGYVNNRAIYINEFFAPFASRLRSEASRTPRPEWIAATREGIRVRLEEIVRDELLRAEAIAQIAPNEEQRRGLLSYFDKKRDSILSAFGGTQSVADEQLAQRDSDAISDFGSNIRGRTVDEVLDSIKRSELIRYQIQTRVSSRAYVTWRDVLIAYQNRYDTFNPPPTVVMSMICVPAERVDQKEEIRRALAAGEDFAALASRDWNTFNAKDAGRLQRTLDGPFESSTLINAPALDRALHELEPGEVGGPIEVGKDVYWVKLDEIRKSPRTMDLYDAQVALEEDIRQQRFNAELARHVERLKARASYTGIEEMTERLTAVAIERYYPATAPATAPAPPEAAAAPGGW